MALIENIPFNTKNSMGCGKKCSSSMPRWCNDVPLGRYWGTNDRRKGL